MTRIRREDVLRYLGIHPRQLRAWEQANLIQKSADYSMEDCGKLRTLRDLSGTRISAIRASLQAMQRVSGMDNPLLDARALRSGPHVLFRHAGSLTEPIARQFVFDFEPEPVDRSARPNQIHAIGRTSKPRLAEQISSFFLQAVQAEDAGNRKAAAELYDKILEIAPNHAASCINLGTICYNQRQFLKAEQLYRRATEADPNYALAFFDLGNVLDELQRLPEAIEAYRRAIRLVPGYADAHYNLGLAYERAGEHRKALRHWMTYLKLDPTSKWAAHARSQARKILDQERLRIVHRSPKTRRTLGQLEVK